MAQATTQGGRAQNLVSLVLSSYRGIGRCHRHCAFNPTTWLRWRCECDSVTIHMNPAKGLKELCTVNGNTYETAESLV